MKYRKLIFSIVIAMATFFFAFYLPHKNEQKEAVLIKTVIRSLTNLHYQPLEIDDEFSKKVYSLYLDRIDGAKRWFTQEDIDKLEQYKLELDDEANRGTYEFFNLSLQLLENAIDKTQDYYREFLAKPIDFSKDESVEFGNEEKPYAKNDAELKDFWRKMMKYETLTRLYDKLEEQKDTEDEELKAKTYEELEANARRDALKVFDNWYKRIKKLQRHDRLSTYINAITNSFDPHTGYYEPIDKENFDINMSGKLEGIGARLRTEEDHTKIVSIVVGGPAWKQGELEENDIILKVAQGDDEPKDIMGMVINDVVQLIRGKKDTEVKLTVKKVDGTVKVISIIRDVVILEEGFAKSLILKTKQGERIGYIRLPRFYADFNDRDGRRCATDMEIEIEKLKDENIAGIIIDLRNNGGGSLRDVVKMAGFFIEEGPIVQVKARSGKPKILDDTNPEVQYDGTLVVMVNSFSASASEILAAALQDYERAVIVGSPTFGKGTVQRFFDLDRAVNGINDVKPLGEIKLTMQKFYRVNGGSTQLKGVTPDIIFPDNYDFIETGEKEHEYPMKWSQINPVSHKQNVNKIKHFKTIIENSDNRKKNNETFQMVEKNAHRLENARKDYDFSLNFEKYETEKEQEELEAKQFEDLFEKVVNESVENLKVDLPAIEANESKKARNDDWIDDIKKDVYVNETLNIIHDLIEDSK